MHYLGTSVPPEKLVNAAIELNADAMLASTIISHDDIHYKNIAKINRIATEMGVRDKLIFVAGGRTSARQRRGRGLRPRQPWPPRSHLPCEAPP